ncbi:MAG: dTDP-4-dehydrorhamnose 3,5-epimerase family protein [Rikenellaceae bacterium]
MSRFKIIKTPIPELLILEPQEPISADQPLTAEEIFPTAEELVELGIEEEFNFESENTYARGVLTGLHFQPKFRQAKLVTILEGGVLDVAVDLRDNKTNGAAHAISLWAGDGRVFYIPECFAHGFVTLEKDTKVAIRYSYEHNPKEELGIIWDDQTLAIDWQFDRYDIDQKYLRISDRDKKNQYYRRFNSKLLWSKKKR